MAIGSAVYYAETAALLQAVAPSADLLRRASASANGDGVLDAPALGSRMSFEG